MRPPSRAATAALVLVLAQACDGPPPSFEPWTPERSDLLFASNHEGNGEIYLLPAGGVEWINLTRHPAGDNWPQWSPDGRRIAFQSARNGKLDIYVMDADGSNLVRLTDDPAHDYLPAWTPDGARITFASWRREPGDGETPANHVYVMDANGGNTRRLLPESPGVSSSVTWSPDGRTMLLARADGERGADLFLLDRAGGLLRRLTDDDAGNGAATFSPDGSRIAFYADSGDVSRLMVIGSDGTGRREVITAGRSWYPRWSPDGRWLVYTAARPHGGEEDLDVMAVPLDGSSPPVTLAGGPGRQAEGQWRWEAAPGPTRRARPRD